MAVVAVGERSRTPRATSRAPSRVAPVPRRARERCSGSWLSSTTAATWATGDSGPDRLLHLEGVAAAFVRRAAGVVRNLRRRRAGRADAPRSRPGGGIGVDVWVTPGHETAPTLAARLCGVAAAARLAGELPPDGAIGLTGGYTVEAVVGALPESTRPRAVVVPLVGGWDSSNPHLNSNEIARHLAERIGASVRLLHAPGLLDNEATTRALLADSAVTATTRFWGELRLALVGMSGAPRFAPGTAPSWIVSTKQAETGSPRRAPSGGRSRPPGEARRLVRPGRVGASHHLDPHRDAARRSASGRHRGRRQQGRDDRRRGADGAAPPAHHRRADGGGCIGSDRV